MAGFGERHISHAGHQPVREYPDTLRCRCSNVVFLPCGAASGAIDSPVGHITDAQGVEFLYNGLVPSNRENLAALISGPS